MEEERGGQTVIFVTNINIVYRGFQGPHLEVFTGADILKHPFLGIWKYFDVGFDFMS